MTMHEFDIIETFFNTQTTHRRDVILGIGDDAAVINVPADQELVITTDTLVSGIHFAPDAAPYDIGYKSLAVNLSDLAAMSATPAWVTLALTLPTVDETWLREFAKGFFDLANRFQTELIGGDLTRGPLSITITAHGLHPKNSAPYRSRAKAGDLIYVTNTLGDAGFALQYKKSLEKLNRPEPQILIGEQLRGIANAAIDISDGLAQDLSHILQKSHVGATVYVDEIPLSKMLRESLPQSEAIKLALTAGDDYELCFTVPEKMSPQLQNALQPFTYTCIGVITDKPGLALQFKNGEKYVLETQGYQHF